MEIAGGDHQLKTDEKAQGRSMLITKIRESSKRIVVERHQYVRTFFFNQLTHKNLQKLIFYL